MRTLAIITLTLTLLLSSCVSSGPIRKSEWTTFVLCEVARIIMDGTSFGQTVSAFVDIPSGGCEVPRLMVVGSEESNLFETVLTMRKGDRFEFKGTNSEVVLNDAIEGTKSMVERIEDETLGNADTVIVMRAQKIRPVKNNTGLMAILRAIF